MQNKNIINILKISFCLLAMVFSVSATQVAHAKTIVNNYTYLDSSRIEFFENIFKRSDYNSYLLASEVTTSGYNNYTTYYFCLSDDAINASSVLSTELNCDEMYRYYRDSSNNYVLDKYNDNTLKVSNSIYYSSSSETKGISIKGYLLGIMLCLFCIFLTFVIFAIFGVIT